jgi:hypothetical protein
LLPVYWQWDPINNPEVRVLRVLSVVDPKPLGWKPEAWRSSVRWACEQYERSGVVAYTVSFEPGAELVEPCPRGFLRVSAQDPANYGSSWWGYQNPHIKANNPGMVYAADVWVSKFAPQDWHRFILAHEFGHILGLDHRTSGKTCMKPVTKAGPDELDLSSVREAYHERNHQ